VSYRYPVLARSFGERCAPLAQLNRWIIFAKTAAAIAIGLRLAISGVLDEPEKGLTTY
jgi:hypothetical protein